MNARRRYGSIVWILLLFTVLVGNTIWGAAALPPSISVAETSGGKYRVTFTYSGTASTAYLAGSFNDWAPDKLEMLPSNGKFSVTIELPEGKHSYKFVLDGKQWKADPLNPETEDDSFGGKNSVLNLTPERIAATKLARANDADVVKSSDGDSGQKICPSVSVQKLPEGKFRVTFRYKNPSASEVFLAGSFNEWNPNALKMQREGDEFVATLELAKGEHEYKFVVDGKEWKEDPQNPNKVSNGLGSENSVIRLPAESSEQGNSAAASSEEKKDSSSKSEREASASESSSADAATSGSVLRPFPSVEIEPLGGKKNRVTFHFKAPGAETVNLAGTFNGWSPTDRKMKKVGDEFVSTLVLPDGEHQYKFVINHSTWKEDPLNPVKTDDGQGGFNSVLRLGHGAHIVTSDAKVGDSKIDADFIFHDPESIDYFNVLSKNGPVVIRLRTLAHDVQEAWLQPLAKGKAAEKHLLRSVYEDERFQFFGVRVPLVTSYTFGVKDGQAQFVIGTDEAKTPPASVKPFEVQIQPDKIFETPEWARHVVWYEIFPERFRNGSKDNDPTGTRTWTMDWERLLPEDQGKFFPSVFFRRYGGDLQGVIEKLPYLKSLGVGAIWFNPIFQSESLHKYDATDYRHVDDQFGYAGEYEKTVAQEDLLDPSTWKFNKSDKLFLELIQKAHAAGIRIIIDGVFNHTGTKHPAFQDVLKNKQKSRFKDWYNITSWDPLEWEGWYGVKDLPVFKENEHGYVDPAVKEHIFAITRRWMDPNGDGDPSDGVDGWRLDVPNEVSSEFWKEWRKLVKSINPNALIMGEIWDPPKQWLRGDQFDCVMNYQFAKALNRFYNMDGTPSRLAQDFAKLLFDIPEQANYVMMNLMNSHDTDRLVSMLYNPGREYDNGNRIQDLKPGQTYKTEKPTTATYTKMKAVVGVQFAYVGGPMIYYGDEAGMWGADDPSDRKPMIWKDLEPYENPQDNYFMHDVFAHFQRCAAIRNTLPALHVGEFETLLADDAKQVYAFRRWTDRQTVITMTNKSDREQEVVLELPSKSPARYVDVLNSPDVKVVPATKLDKSDVTRIDVSRAKPEFKALNNRLIVKMPPTSTRILLGL
ncbi:MAG: hypothetical protein KatS3mg130_2079 [Candidatus Sumerlaea sp.]|nr:MAG: hypothetical protein KatS3mg130_2079 [Candidatus Sumerlaea sp.]